jgi:hypothetical protein
MASPTFQYAVAANERTHCDNHKNCGGLRAGINRFCAACLPRSRLYGHPEARLLRPSMWATERQRVAQLLAVNADHPGLRAVMSFLDGWSARACANGQAFKGAEDVARVARHGVSTMTVLTELAAFHVWLQRNPHGLPDQRACDFAMSRAVFGLAPRPRRFVRAGGRWPVGDTMTAKNSYSPKPRASGLAYVGGHLREVLGPFLANVALSIEQQDQQKADYLSAMRAPLRAPEAA